MSVFFTSDWHFNHDKEFVWKKRGFKSVYEMNEEIIKRHNSLVQSDDIVYFLGDAMFGDINDSLSFIRRLNGQIYAIIGNHDTENKRELLRTLPNWHEVGYATVIKENGLRFYLAHYPTITASPLEDKKLKSRTICLYGHTHQNISSFFDDKNPFVYHIGQDSHDCRPVNIDTVIEEIRRREDGLK